MLRLLLPEASAYRMLLKSLDAGYSVLLYWLSASWPRSLKAPRPTPPKHSHSEIPPSFSPPQ